MGLAQHAIESAGITTISLSTIWSFTASAGAPRVAAIEHPMSLPLGQPGDAEGQRAVLRATFAALQEMRDPGEVRHLPFTWPEPRGKAIKRGHPPEPPPIVRLLKRKPWLAIRMFARAFPN